MGRSTGGHHGEHWMPPHNDVHHEVDRRVLCWKFEKKIQIMSLGFGYLESLEKSEKVTQILHRYYMLK